MKYLDGKLKALTFSYDDGVTQDRRLIKILNKYGLKATFNINSGLLGNANSIFQDGVTTPHVKPRPEEVRGIYKDHELAVHTLHHPALNRLTDDEIVKEVEEDRIALSELAGYEVVGMAYPGGTGCMDERVVRVLAERTGVKYSRTTTSTYNFEPQTELLVFDPSVFHLEQAKLFELGEQFLKLEPDHPQIFYVWGHAYEFEVYDFWERFEEFCKMMAGRDDIFYGTNREVLLGY
jgi:peptidoglycan/xylan/chitin deacetylase (PgdA/CDA1 family)